MMGPYHLTGVVEEVEGANLTVLIQEQRVITHTGRIYETIRKCANDEED